jgi:hypothetical protein
MKIQNIIWLLELRLIQFNACLSEKEFFENLIFRDLLDSNKMILNSVEFNQKSVFYCWMSFNASVTSYNFLTRGLYLFIELFIVYQCWQYLLKHNQF